MGRLNGSQKRCRILRMEKSLSSHKLVTKDADLEGVAKAIEGAKVVGVDLETTGLSPRDDRVRLVQLATGEETYVIDVFEAGDLSLLKEVLEDGPEKALHNGKFDYAFLREQFGISLSPIFDTMLAAQLLGGGDQTQSYSLEAVAQRYVGVELDKSSRMEDWSGKLSSAQIEYAARDAAVLLGLRERLKKGLEAEELGYVSGIEFRAMPTIAEMELAGIKLDLARWRELESTVRARRDAAAEHLESFFPEPEGVLPLEGLGPRLNLNSPKQITDAFRSLGIELPDTKEWTLLKVDHPAARALREYRELQKKLGTYLETYPKFIHPKTGRIHANFLQCRVPTGRLACVAQGTLVQIARDQSKNSRGIPIEEVRAGDLAYTYDEDKKLTLRRVLWAGKTGHKEVLSIRWRSGSHKREGVLEVTPDHEVRLASGEYVRAEHLKPKDRVLALGRDTTGWGYSRIYATGYPGPISEHRFVFEAVNGFLPEHVHHADGSKRIKARFEGIVTAPNNHEILSVERSDRYTDVYDLQIEETHNFIAGEICLHNCTNPNIQQIPHEDEFRSCFVAEEGNVLVIADYSQIELRILAEVSDDPEFVRAFREGEDLHRLTAATMFGVAMNEVTREQRSSAKRINFGLMYGRGARSLSAQLGASEEHARVLIDEYFANYPKVQRYLNQTANRALKDRTLRTIAGRVRKFEETAALGSRDRGSLRREAMNYPIQGSASDIAKLALVYVRDELEGTGAQLVNCVHDEFVVECAEEMAPEVEEKTKSAMLRAGADILNKVPVEVEVATSREWKK